jgi:hypothetical protein
MKEGTKILLIPDEKGAVVKVKGVRYYTPFPSFDLGDNWLHATEHALCFIPQEDLTVVGFACFRIYRDEATSHTVRLNYKIYDS